MRIDTVDFFYARMPEVTLEADGSQDSLLVRVSADGVEGWGECEASPLVSIAAFVTPRSHGVCQPVSASVLGQRLDSVADLHRIGRAVERNSMDLLQAAHTYSGIEIALWDLLGKARDLPVWKLLGFPRAYPKLPYASVLFGDTPEATFVRARNVAVRGFRAAKFGWGPFGVDVETDALHLAAAREGIGDARVLLVDAGQIWTGDVDAAAQRLPAMQAAAVTWLEEPFATAEYAAYADLGRASDSVRIAGGEGAHNEVLARNLVEFGKVGFIQIDTGRIGGIGPASRIAALADQAGVTYVNHTFTSQLALSASLQPFAGLERHRLCEYPADPKPLARAITRDELTIDESGELRLPTTPGLGVRVDLEALAPYLHDVRIDLDGDTVYASPKPPLAAALTGGRNSDE